MAFPRSSQSLLYEIEIALLEHISFSELSQSIQGQTIILDQTKFLNEESFINSAYINFKEISGDKPIQLEYILLNI